MTWDCIDISDDKVENNTAFVYVEKELQRVYRTAVTELDGKYIMKIFPAITDRANTCLVVKTPKTQTSARKIFLPKMVADVYSHIIDDDRRLNAEIFEKTFYSSETANEEKPTATEESGEKSDQELLLQLLAKSPDLVNVIKALAKTI